MADRHAFNPHIHGARGLFSLMVFVYHVVNSGLPTVPGIAGSWFDLHVLRSLNAGVELFFGISGIVIVGALARAPGVSAFAWDRATRIYPVLWLTLLAIIVLAWAAGDPRGMLGSPGDLVLNFTAPPPFLDVPMIHPAAWSLGYEMTFYMLCAAAWGLRTAGIRWWLWAAIAVGAVLVIFFPRSILMIAGVLTANAMLPDRVTKLAARYPFALLILFLISWRAIAVWGGGAMIYVTPGRMPIDQWLLFAPFIIASAVIGTMALQGIAEGRGLFNRMLRLPAMQWAGTVSYSFYLWHPIVMAVIKNRMHAHGIVSTAGDLSQILFLLLSLPPSLIVSHYSQRWIEARLTRRLRAFGPQGKKGAKVPATAVVQTGQ